MTRRLNINGVDVPLSQRLAIEVSYAIAEIQDPASRDTTRSKPITIIGGGEVDRLFNFIFDVNSVGDSFNPNKKVPATYFVNEIPVFYGNIQLLSITKKFSNSTVILEYECYMMGMSGDFFTAIAAKKLTDLDFSDLDHYFDNTSDKYPVVPPSPGSDYCYPFIDYGSVGVPQIKDWYFETLKPAIFEKVYLDRIFAAAGKTYTSTFLESDYYKSIIIPSNEQGTLVNTAIPLADYLTEAYVSPTVTGDTFNATLTINNRWLLLSIYSDYYNPVPFNSITTDPSGAFDTTDFIWECQNAGVYNFASDLNVNVNITSSNNSTQILGQFKFEVSVWKRDDVNANWEIIGIDFISMSFDQLLTVGLNNTYTQSLNLPVTTQNINCVSTSQVKVAIRQSDDNYFRVLNGLSFVTTGTVTASIDLLNNSNFTATASSFALNYGELVEMNLTIPKNVNQTDFIKSIMICENLYMEQDPTNPNNFFIEPRDTFTNDGVRDWSGKQDRTKEERVLPMGLLDFKTYKLRYKSDTDKYNEDYLKRVGENLGTHEQTIDNDFLKQTKNIEVIFAPTPMVGSFENDLVAPRMYKDKSLFEVQPVNTVIRRLIWGGLINCDSFNWHVNGASSPTTSYPFCGTVDHPYTPTVDLNFGLPKLLYYQFTGTYTDNNRYNAQYSRMITEITDRDSKIVRKYMRLTEVDMYLFTFRKLIYIDGTYYICNRIIDFDPQSLDSVLCEFLKLKTAEDFTPSSFSLSANERGIVMA